MRLYLVLFFMSGCGIHVTSDPIEVNHNININFEQIALYCQDLCTDDLNPTECQSDCFTKIVNAITAGITQ